MRLVHRQVRPTITGVVMANREGRPEGNACALSPEALGALIGLLRDDGYLVLGPRVREGAIVYGEISSLGDLPKGWGEQQEAGRYRLVKRDDPRLFGFSVGPQSWKPQFFVPRARLVRLRRTETGFEQEAPAPPPRLALLGARACDLAAISIQDRTFLGGPFREPDYESRRRDVLVVAVNCGQAGGTCFCVSMETGPRVRTMHDIVLTELLDPHRFIAEAGTSRGRALLNRLGAPEAAESEAGEVDRICDATARSMGRALDTTGIKELLYGNQEHPRWDDVATRCLGCANCTLVCPTCFCSNVEDTSDLSGQVAERWRRWDSCFTLGHSYVHGGSARPSTRARYRQWLTHKLASWIDQFGTSGCVGCGRCITWCPVGIDITAEVAAIRATDARTVADAGGGST
jgi:formate hydrogenlyase subunit 6/NADH:ubiquinone oxidoreductase subunit I